MREIKFRGQTIKGNWVIGNLAILKGKFRDLEPGYYISNGPGAPFAFQVIPETVGQFTGLLDKNGKEIYEGDILIRELSRADGTIFNTALARCYYDSYKAGFYSEWFKETDLNSGTLLEKISLPLNAHIKGFKVIGNIYENPELVG